jgi:uncharacterized OB-fold protein
MEPAPRPLPAPDRDTEPFWAAMNKGRLTFQKCVSCGTVRYPVGPLCPNCYKFETEWITSSGNGTVFSFTVVRHQTHPSFPVPYTILVVEMAEGPRVVARLEAPEETPVSIGMRVRVDFEDAGGQMLPMFRILNA